MVVITKVEYCPKKVSIGVRVSSLRIFLIVRVFLMLRRFPIVGVRVSLLRRFCIKVVFS